jgi:hypothetical protein
LRDAAGGRGELVDAGELRGGREGGARGKKGMLLGVVKLSKARGGVYIGFREERRDVAGMMATSRARRVQASPSWLLRRKGEVRSRGRRVCSGWLAGVVCRAYGDDADVGVLVGVASCRRPGARAGLWPFLECVWG